MVSTFLLQQLIIVFWQSYCKVDRPLEVFKVSRQTETFNCIVPVKCNSTFLPDHDVDEMGAIKLGRGSSSAPSVYLLFFPQKTVGAYPEGRMRHTFFLSLFLMQFPLRNFCVSRRDEQPDCILSHHMCVYYVECFFWHRLNFKASHLFIAMTSSVSPAKKERSLIITMQLEIIISSRNSWLSKPRVGVKSYPALLYVIDAWAISKKRAWSTCLFLFSFLLYCAHFPIPV